MRAFEQLEGESRKAYAAFSAYRDLGPERSIDLAYEVYSGKSLGGKRAPGGFQRWSRDHDWVERAGAWDDYLDMVRLGAVEDAERANAEDLSARKRRVSERLVSLAERSLDRAEKMLEYPLTRREVVEVDDSGRPVRIAIHPAGWTHQSIARHLITAQQVGTDALPTGDPGIGGEGRGKSADEIDREFEEAFGGEGVGADGPTG